MYEVLLTEESLRFYRRADVPLARKLNRCFDQIDLNPRFHSNIKRLTGELRGLWRFRVGDWRVVYRIDEDRRTVLVLMIGHRRGVYR